MKLRVGVISVGSVIMAKIFIRLNTSEAVANIQNPNRISIIQMTCARKAIRAILLIAEEAMRLMKSLEVYTAAAGDGYVFVTPSGAGLESTFDHLMSMVKEAMGEEGPAKA